MLGCLNVTTKTWFWRNETDKFNSLLPKYYSDLPEVHVTAACSSYSEMSSSSDRMDSFSDWMVLYCFKKDNYNSTSHQTNGIVQFNIKFSDNSNFMESVTVQSTDTLSGQYYVSGQQHAIWLDDSNTLRSTLDKPLQVPGSQFTFRRLASSGDYIYHQVSDSILAEKLWNGQKDFQSSADIMVNPGVSEAANKTVVSTISLRRFGLARRTKIALGVSVPVASIIVCAIVVFGTKRYRKNEHSRQSDNKAASPEDNQLYFQQKGELEADETIRVELDAAQRQPELDGQNEIREMSTAANDNTTITCQRQELRAEEHCRELETDEHAKELE
ncbi:MAG: hypothetical protein L6R39_003355 [Caloplaca ligustica]|nr:MAG: hypothetical protein L6R39_003355 [Caloplaca ligustica]